MKINLSDKDYHLDELYYNIQRFAAFNNGYPKYIVMSERTLSLIECHVNYHISQDMYFLKHKKRYVGEIFGIPVAYNDDLDFGVVDIV